MYTTVHIVAKSKVILQTKLHVPKDEIITTFMPDRASEAHKATIPTKYLIQQ